MISEIWKKWVVWCVGEQLTSLTFIGLKQTDNPTDTQTIQSFRIKISLREYIFTLKHLTTSVRLWSWGIRSNTRTSRPPLVSTHSTVSDTSFQLSPVCLSVYLSIYLYICLSVYLSIWPVIQVHGKFLDYL